MCLAGLTLHLVRLSPSSHPALHCLPWHLDHCQSRCQGKQPSSRQLDLHQYLPRTRRFLRRSRPPLSPLDPLDRPHLGLPSRPGPPNRRGPRRPRRHRPDRRRRRLPSAFRPSNTVR